MPGTSPDTQWLANVRPAEWVNPTPQRRYHLVVIGGGTAGLVSAAGAAGLGARVALVERHRLGGDCLNTGCVPSKGILAAARAWHAAAAGAYGAPATDVDGDFAAAMDWMRRVRAAISPADSAERFRDLGVDVYFGEASFASADAIVVGGQQLRFRRAILATGARPAVPPIPGLEGAGYLTNETIFSLPERPRRLLVLGGGPVGCELAQAFQRLGSSVTLIERETRLLGREDADASEVVAAALRRDGVVVHVDATVRAAARTPQGVELHLGSDEDPLVVEGDALLVAAGRTPNLEQLELARAGVEVDRGRLVVDDRHRTTNRRILAVGDVAGGMPFTHAADAQARQAIANALFPGRARRSRLIIPRCTYTSPEVAQVGLTPAEADQQRVALDTVTIPLEENDRARLDGEPEGFLRIHLRRGTDRLLGVTIVAERAGELIGEAVVAMTHGVGLGGLGQAIHPYPTVSELYRRAADQWRRRKLTPWVRRVLGAWFRLIQ